MTVWPSPPIPPINNDFQIDVGCSFLLRAFVSRKRRDLLNFDQTSSLSKPSKLGFWQGKMQILESPLGSNAKPQESTAYPRRDPRIGSQFQTKILQNCTKNDGRRPPDRVAHDHVYSYCCYDSKTDSNEGENEICYLLCHKLPLWVAGSWFVWPLDPFLGHFQSSWSSAHIHVVVRFWTANGLYLTSGD